MPEAIRMASGDNARGWLKNLSRLGPSRVPLHAANGRRPEVESGAGEDLGDFHLPEGRTEEFETPHDVAYEVGKLVHRFRQADERVRALLIETPHPRGDGERGHQEDPGD